MAGFTRNINDILNLQHLRENEHFIYWPASYNAKSDARIYVSLKFPFLRTT